MGNARASEAVRKYLFSAQLCGYESRRRRIAVQNGNRQISLFFRHFQVAVEAPFLPPVGITPESKRKIRAYEHLLKEIFSQTPCVGLFDKSQ